MYVGTETNAFQCGQRANVYLFGLKAKCVLRADDVEGWIDLHKLDGNGNLTFDDRGELATYRIYGDVRIELLP